MQTTGSFSPEKHAFLDVASLPKPSAEKCNNIGSESRNTTETSAVQALLIPPGPSEAESLGALSPGL